MKRVLWCGDPHVTVEDLDDCEQLLWLINAAIASRAPIDMVVFAGDLHHTHSLVHVEVIAFWRRWFQNLGVPIVALKGNHDEPSTNAEGLGPNALMAYKDMPGVLVVDRPIVKDGLGFLPYYASNDLFLQAAQNCLERGAVHTLFCHQTFDGSRYENGAPAIHGVEPDKVPQAFVISGHIHTPQEFAKKIWYPGAPRHRTRSDANSARDIWIMKFSDEGVFQGAEPISTFPSCHEIRHTVIRDGVPVDGYAMDFQLSTLGPPAVPDNVTWYVDLYGDAPTNELLQKILRPSGHLLRTFNTDGPAPRVRESEGVVDSFRKWMSAFRARNGTPPAALLKAAEERLGWRT